MPSTSRRLRVTAAPFGLIGAIALIFAGESTIVRNKLDTMDGGLWMYEAARANMAANVKDARVLYFGDSLIKLGVSPRVVEARSGLKGHNLAIPGSPAPVSYILFRRALEAGARPEAVVVDYMPCLLDTDPWPNITNWPFILTYADCLEMAWHARDPKLFAALALRESIPSVAYRESLRANIQLALKGMGELNRLGVLVALRAWKANQGLAIEGYRFNPAIDIKIAALTLFSDVRCRPINQHYVDKFMALAAARQIKVFWVMPPHMPIMQAEVERNGYDAKHEALVRSMLGRYPDLTVVDGRKANYSPGSFIDTHHLSFSGAHTFSEELGAILRDRLDHPEPGPKWVNLPPFRDRPPTIRHEVIDETRAIVLQEVMEAKKRR